MIQGRIWWSALDKVLIISGQSNAGKSHFIQQLMVEAMLPSEYNGNDLNVIFLETRTTVKLRAILDRMAEQIRRANERISEEEIDKVSQTILLDKFKTCRVYNLNEFDAFLPMLESILEVRKGTVPTIFVLDCLATFYRSDCTTTPPVNQSRRLAYAKKVFKTFYEICQRFDCPFITGFRTDEDINMEVDRVYLETDNQRGRIKYTATVYQGLTTKVLNYRISDTGIEWMKI